jgi:hypothetical protein
MTGTRTDAIRYVGFDAMDFSDPFFESLRNAYEGFDGWLSRKAGFGESAWISLEDDGSISSMLYLKPESDTDETTSPKLTLKRLKIGTFKVDFDHHTSIGNRLLAIALREFAKGTYEYAYLTMYDAPNTQVLKRRLSKYGFRLSGSKGDEELWDKRRPRPNQKDPYQIFPFIRWNEGNDYLLSIMPKYHVRMFGEVDLTTERTTPVEDTIPINTIEKVYLSGARNAPLLRRGDHIILYRSGDGKGPAAYRSLVTGIGTVTEVKDIDEFADEREFDSYIHGRSVFTQQELHDFWIHRQYPHIISFLYNTAFTRHPIRKTLLEQGLIQQGRIVCEPIDKTTFKRILDMGEINESYIVD